MSKKIINIESKREMFWDDYLVDKSLTTAFPRLLQPTFKEQCFLFDQGEEMYAISYPCIVKDDKGYKMYYTTWKRTGGAYVAVIESTDGLHWTRPVLNIYEHPELADNNVVIDKVTDGLFVFYDTNPDCPLEEKYKAFSRCHFNPENWTELPGGLWCFTSPDGYHFKVSHLMATYGMFDSLNVAYWDGEKYVCYIRNFHKIPGGIMTDGIEDYNRRQEVPQVLLNEGIRDVRVMYSTDFRNWTEPEQIVFDDGQDHPLYTNNIVPYERAPHTLIGFPTRYCERKVWTANVDQMPSWDVKRKVYEEEEPRSGLALTDCIFMCSHDGKMWHRYNEAFMTPGYEHAHNWVYGDCYPAYNLIDSGRETYYLYSKDWHMSYGYSKPLNVFEIRKDGFACYMADGEERVLTTKPLVFTGKDLHLNFSTSAYGYIYVEVLDEEGNPLSEQKSFEIYGDTIDRKICFADGSDFAAFAGRTMRLRFTMRDAKLYSMRFE